MTPELVASIVAVLGAIAAWIKSKTDTDKIRSDRAQSKHDRDTEIALLQQRVVNLETNQGGLTESIQELQRSIVSLQLSVNELLIEIKHKADK